MRVSLRWKEKVVRSIVILLGILIFHTSYSQSISAPISISFKATTLDKVMDHLSRTSGFHVIYSSDKIDVKTPISLSVDRRTVGDILVLLEKQTNLSFKVHDRHIIIRPAKVMVSQPLLVSKINYYQQPGNTPSNIIARPTIEERRLQINMPDERFLRSERYIKNHLPQLQMLIDTSWIKFLPHEYINRLDLNNMNKGWFISAGPVVNDYSAGVEVQIGLKYIYAVYDASWLKSGQFHAAYGLGTSVPLSNSFSITPAYMYSGWSESRSQTNALITRNGVNLVEFKTTEYVRHHQFKMLIQYSVSKNIRVQLGPVFNKASKYYTMAEPGNTVMTEYTVKAAPYSGADRVVQSRTVNQVFFISRDPQAANFWLGWEASLSYKLNFSTRP
jgi:hypothetical protein